MFKSDPLLSYEESLHHPYPQQQQQELQNTATPQEDNYSPVRHGGIMEPSDPDEFCKNKRVRYKFMAKVFFILFAQMLFIMFIVAMFMFIDPVRLFVRQYPGLFFFPSLLFFLTTYFLILSCHKARRQFPWNLVLLVTFTLAMSFLAGVTSSCLDMKSLLFLLGIMTYVCFNILAIFWFEQAKVTDCAFTLYILATTFPILGFLAVFTMYARFIRVIDVILTVHGLTFYTFLLAVNTTLLLDIAAVSLRPNEYVFGALAIYIAYSCRP